MSKKLLLCFALLIGLVSFAMAQRTVTGTVTDELTKEALIQATVVIKGTTQGTVTDENGKFKLENVPNNAVLTVSFAGSLTQDVNTGVLSEVNISLKTDQGGEVVITGYQVVEKRSLVGSIGSVKGSTIENLPMQSFDRAMQGRIAGVQVSSASGQPGGALSIKVRGVGSINGGTEPLYIIDGVQVRQGRISTQASSNALAGLNPNDIESIEVLKDASASAIYGAQAANGVVIITTKKGKEGKSQINFAVQEGIVQPMNLYNMMDARQFATIRAASIRNSQIDGGSPLNSAAAINLYGDPNNPNLQSYNWLDAIFRTGRQSSYDVSINGGDNKTTFFISGSYTKQEGQVQENYWSRGSMKANFTHKATDKLSIGINLNGSWQSSRGAAEASTGTGANFVNNPFNAAFAINPNSPAINPETGRYNLYPVSSPGSHFFGLNALQLINEEVRLAKTFQFLGSSNLSYKITKDLTANILGAIDFINLRADNQRPSTIPAYAPGTVTVITDRIFNFNANANLQYSKTFSVNHRISALLGFEYKIEQQENANVTGQTFINPRLRQLSSAGNIAPGGWAGNFTEYKRQGIFGQVKYDYMDKYFIDLTLRRDGSSRFGLNNRWGNFYAAALAWRISAENFMASTKRLISDLKLRVSYGVLGNSEIGNFPSINLFATGGGTAATYNGVPLIRQTQLGNDLLGWESQGQFNIGTDVDLWNGKVRLTFDYWNKINYDLLLNTVLAANGGAGFSGGNYVITGNAGKMLNRGFDIDLTTTNLDTKWGLKWTTSFNISFLKNEILELADGQKRIGSDLFVGQARDVIFGDEFAGVNPATGRAIYLDTLGNPTYRSGTALTQRVLGKQIPDYFGGFNNTFSYKGISLDIFFQYQVGNSAFIADFANIANAGVDGGNQIVSQMAYWQKPGDVTNVPRPTEAGSMLGTNNFEFVTSRSMSDASYIRLKQVRLSYEVPSDKLAKFGLRRLNVFAQAINLWTYTKFSGIDPEVVGEVTATNGSGTFGTYPLGRQFNVGLALGF